MKLKNKRTGEIIDDGYVRETHDFQFDGQKHVLAVFKGNGHRPPERVSGAYKSLAELNEEWEDYEEPKDFWFIDPEILIACESTDPLLCDKKVAIETMKQIGNYFSSREEAEKAVKKLKAWKRLKDNGFRFKGWRTADLGADKYYFVITAESDGAGKKDLDLLFGGEE